MLLLLVKFSALRLCKTWKGRHFCHWNCAGQTSKIWLSLYQVFVQLLISKGLASQLYRLFHTQKFVYTPTFCPPTSLYFVHKSLNLFPNFCHLHTQTLKSCLRPCSSVYHFQNKSTQYYSNWLLFTIICSKYTQFMQFGHLHLWEKPTNCFT